MATRTKVEPGLDINKIKALSHPLRWHALQIFNSRVASPNEIANELGVDVNKIAYHVRQLDKFGYIELVDTKPRRGATEHYFRATGRAVLTDDEWVHIPRNFKDDIVAAQTKATGEAISESLADGTFNSRDDRRQSWIPIQVDEQGWTDAMAVLAEAEEKFLDIAAESANRLAESGEDSIPMAASLMGFELSSGSS